MKVPAEPVVGEWYDFVDPVYQEPRLRVGERFTRGQFKYYDQMNQRYCFLVRERLEPSLIVPPIDVLLTDATEPRSTARRAVLHEGAPELMVWFPRESIERHVKLPLVEDDPFVEVFTGDGARAARGREETRPRGTTWLRSTPTGTRTCRT